MQGQDQNLHQDPQLFLATPDAAHAAATARLALYKRAAIAAKRLNDKQAALDFLRCAKQCEAILEHCEFVREGVMDWSDAKAAIPALPPQPPPHILTQLNAAAMQAAPSSSQLPPTSPQPAASAVANRPASLPAILDALRSQIASCTAASAFYYARNDKARALQFHRYKKTFTTDLAALEGLSPGAPLPSLDTLDVTYQRELSFPHLSLEEYEVVIERASGLSLTKSGLAPGTPIPVLVIWDVGYPEATGKGETTVVNTASADTDINQSFRIGIGDRKNKGLQRHLERRKALFEVLYQSGGLFGSGLFSSRISLGKAQLKLDALLTKTEIHEVVKLVDANRRPMGGSLELRIRMRQPLLRADVAELTERWISLRRSDGGSPVVSPTTLATSASPAAQTAPLAARSRSPSPKRTVASSSAAPSSVPVAPSPAPPTAAPSVQPVEPAPPAPPAAAAPTVPSTSDANDDLQASLDYVDSPDSLVSCLVLEHELQALVGGSGDAVDDRRSALQLKLQLLQLNVEMGTLTMAAYKAQLERGIAEAKKHAVALKRGTKLAEAKKVLMWINLMKQEVGEIDGMLAGAGPSGDNE